MIERVAVAQRAMLAPTIRSSAGPSDRFVLRFMQLRDVVSSFAVVFRFFCGWCPSGSIRATFHAVA